VEDLRKMHRELDFHMLNLQVMSSLRQTRKLEVL